MTGSPLCIDLFCGLGGWTEGFLAEGWRVVGFDNHRHSYGGQQYPAQLVLQDVLTIHGSQFKNADCIVASPPCQQYSWLAMPWSRSKDPNNSKAAKALRKEWETNGPDNRLFDACFRIQREAIEATCRCGGAEGNCGPCSSGWHCCECGYRHIPLIVENVRGAQPWVGKRDMPLDEWLALSPAEKMRRGRSAWNFGSFHLFGDVPALMPFSNRTALKRPGRKLSEGFNNWPKDENGNYILPDGTACVDDGTKNNGGSWFAVANNTESGHSKNPVHELAGKKMGGSWFFPKDNPDAFCTRNNSKPLESSGPDGTKIGGDWFSDPNSTCRKHGSRSQARKAASAQIAKIPLALSSWIARVYKPRTEAAA